jgi:hypothetical protein
MREAWEREIRDEQDMSGVGEKKKKKKTKNREDVVGGRKKKVVFLN